MARTIPVPLGNEFPVNTTTAGDQQAARVATCNSGAFVVVWQGPDSSGPGIFAQRYGSSGAAAGLEFRVNVTTTGNQLRPAVAMMGNCEFVVAWEGSGISGAGIYLRRFLATGTPASGEVLANSSPTGAKTTPAVAFIDDGDILVAWRSGAAQCRRRRRPGLSPFPGAERPGVPGQHHNRGKPGGSRRGRDRISGAGALRGLGGTGSGGNGKGIFLPADRPQGTADRRRDPRQPDPRRRPGKSGGRRQQLRQPCRPSAIWRGSPTPILPIAWWSPGKDPIRPTTTAAGSSTRQFDIGGLPLNGPAADGLFDDNPDSPNQSDPDLAMGDTRARTRTIPFPSSRCGRRTTSSLRCREPSSSSAGNGRNTMPLAWPIPSSRSARGPTWPGRPRSRWRPPGTSSEPGKTSARTALLPPSPPSASPPGASWTGRPVKVTKTVAGPLFPGSNVFYSITMTNHDLTSIPDHAGDELTDVLPGGLLLTFASAPSGTTTTGGNTVHWNGTIAAGDTVVVSISAVIMVGSGHISNQATFPYDFNNDGIFESTLLSDDPGVVGTANPTRFFVKSPIFADGFESGDISAWSQACTDCGGRPEALSGFFVKLTEWPANRLSDPKWDTSGSRRSWAPGDGGGISGPRYPARPPGGGEDDPRRAAFRSGNEVALPARSAFFQARASFDLPGLRPGGRRQRRFPDFRIRRRQNPQGSFRPRPDSHRRRPSRSPKKSRWRWRPPTASGSCTATSSRKT